MIIAGGKGTAADKFSALEDAGIHAVGLPAEIHIAIRRDPENDTYGSLGR